MTAQYLVLHGVISKVQRNEKSYINITNLTLLLKLVAASGLWSYVIIHVDPSICGEFDALFHGESLVLFRRGRIAVKACEQVYDRDSILA